MANIQFDVLVTQDKAERVAEVFQEALDKIVASGQLASGTVSADFSPRLPEGLEEELRKAYREEHEDRDLEGASVCRYLCTVAGQTGSLNQLAMVLSRRLTPQAALPRDHVLLEDELAHEQAAIFPWSVEIRP